MNTLTMMDRGDCCPAQARVLAGKDGQESLLFCLHHFNMHEVKLTSQGWEILIDDRASLLAKTGVEVS